MEIIYIIGSTELLNVVGPLWEKLNVHHAERSPYFGIQYAEGTYAERRARLLEKAESAILRVELAWESETGYNIGYCVSSVTEAAGVIESIFIEADYRGQGIGDTLMQHALTWMDSHNVSVKQVVVAVGNEEAFGFYARYGFRPRHTILRQLL
ncbi:MAG: GNAT family N-acetyltransferase [Anaerolineae bacterium]|nr:GNAT family N-acetyltransferase [Anaerolineae bacterium]